MVAGGLGKGRAVKKTGVEKYAGQNASGGFELVQGHHFVYLHIVSI
ncbi:hypothetical protein SDC9_83183 [bioreactor metagenome]|uniref:Uncharacterized protein n=1 Tax=bioreactor metagenome TaxID=1076179 RepID=A0A644ZFE1_9ZZZZ